MSDQLKTVALLTSRVIQLVAVPIGASGNNGDYTELIALCEDGSIWMQFRSNGYANRPDDGMWRQVQPPTLPVAGDELIVEAQIDWRPIESAPKDGSEILTWREDTGVLLLRWASATEFMTQAELDLLDEDEATEPGWFCADYDGGCRLDGADIPTHWRPMPLGPGEAC